MRITALSGWTRITLPGSLDLLSIVGEGIWAVVHLATLGAIAFAMYWVFQGIRLTPFPYACFIGFHALSGLALYVAAIVICRYWPVLKEAGDDR